MRDHRPPPTKRTTPYILGRIRHFRALVYVDSRSARRQMAITTVQARRHQRPKQLLRFAPFKDWRFA